MATPEQVQTVHHSVLRHFIDTGHAPHYTELAGPLGVDPETARTILHESVAESPFSFGWMTPDTDYLGNWAPFSSLPNQHAISVDGERRWFGT